jgi:hypothetical protein
MDRFQTVNGGQDTMHPTGAFELRPPDYADESLNAPLGGAGANSGKGDYGTCLYFGPNGQRCERRALASGFCGRHANSAAPRMIEAADAGAAGTREDGPKARVRAAAAVLGLLGVLWPLVAEIIKAILSFLNRK